MTGLFENFPLKSLNTFGIDVGARHFFRFSKISELIQFQQSGLLSANNQKLILGGGSNLLFTGNYNGTILYPSITGIQVEAEDRFHVFVRVGSGVVWDDFVNYSVTEGWGGIENLSLIPGKAGAAPVQNIGAYGQEASQVIKSVTGFDLITGESLVIESGSCRFGYRSSIFKLELKDRFVITSVLFRLNKFHEINSDYQGIREALKHIQKPDISHVRQAVISIRRSKLPDPEEIGNAGSFFKNPVIKTKVAEELKLEYPAIPIYPLVENEFVKISAGWLIDQCGWKGFRRGDAGVHAKHALVLVNYGNASGKEIFDLSEMIVDSVLNRFGIALDREVQVVGV